MSSMTLPSSATFWDKIRYYIALVWEKLCSRFSSASEAFQERLRWERNVIENKIPVDLGQPDLVLAGYLFSKENERPRPIYEGINQIPGEETHFELEKDRLRVAETGVEFGSNEWLEFESKAYFIKLLSKKYRLKGIQND